MKWKTETDFVRSNGIKFLPSFANMIPVKESQAIPGRV